MIAAAAGYLALALVLTWPLARDAGSSLGGAGADQWQTLWGLWWVKEAVLSGRSPWFTPLLHHPHGVDLVQQTLDLPGALVALPLWPFLPEVAVLNVVVLWTFVASGVAAALLVRELGAGRLAAVLAGALYTAAPFHVSHAGAHLHVAEMEFTPLYLFFLLRAVRRESAGAAVAGGLALAAAGAASWYHLLYAACLTPFVLGWLVADRDGRARLGRPRAWGRLALLGATALVVLGPLVYRLLAAGRAEPWWGGHDPVAYSADLQQFFRPNPVQRLAAVWPPPGWTGNAVENSGYLGWVVLALALFGAWRRGAARALVLAALAGLVLSLGPHLWVGGRLVWQGDLPYAWLERAFPVLARSGVPVRFAWLAVAGVTLAAGFGLDEIVRGRRRAGPWLALAATALALLEYAPRPFPQSRFPDPAWMRAWAADPAPWAVLDASGTGRSLWNGVLHGHPQVGGYTSRIPKRLLDWWLREPFVGAVALPRGRWRSVATAVEPGVAHDWGGGAPAGVFDAARFSATWTGTLLVPTAGSWGFEVAAAGRAELFLDGRPVLAGGGERPVRAARALGRGTHPLRLVYESRGDPARVALGWRPPGGGWEPIPQAALRTPAGAPGLAVEYAHLVNATGLPRARIHALLRALDVRYVILPEERRDYAVEVEAGLPLRHRDGGLRVYEVPPAPAPPRAP